jgi:hypothetical protein
MSGTSLIETKQKHSGWKDDGTEQAIVEYVAASDYDRKNAIFTEHIYTPLLQMVYGLMAKHHITHLDESWDNVAQDTVSHLTLHLHEWKSLRGSSAFSFFYTVAKYYLWSRNKLNVNREVKHVSIYDLDDTQEDGVDSLLMSSVVPEDNLKENDTLTNKELQRWKALSEYVNRITDKKFKIYHYIVTRVQTLLDNPELIRVPTNAQFCLNENIAGSKVRKLKDRVMHNLPILLRRFDEHRITEDGNHRIFEDGSSKVSEQSREDINAEVQIK